LGNVRLMDRMSKTIDLKKREKRRKKKKEKKKEKGEEI